MISDSSNPLPLPVKPAAKNTAEPQVEMEVPNVVHLVQESHNAKLKAEALDGRASIKEVAEKRQDIYWINPYRLKVRPDWNVRLLDDPENIAHIDDLAKQISVQGVKVPLTVYYDKADRGIYVVDGHMRLAAAIKAIEEYRSRIVSVPCKTDEAANDDAERMKYQILANNGKRLSTFERAKLFTRYVDLGWGEKRIGTTFNVQPNYVSKLVRLYAQSPDELKQMIAQGLVTPTLALQIAQESDGDFRIATEHLNRAIENAVSSGKRKVTRKNTTTSEPIDRIGPKKMRYALANVCDVLGATLASLRFDDGDDPADVVTIAIPKTKMKALAQILQPLIVSRTKNRYEGAQ
jgi:hypothetical protein